MRRIQSVIQVFTLTLACLLAKNTAQGQQTVVDSSLLQRVAALEQQVADQKPGESHFMVVGLTTFGFVYNKTTFTPPGGPAQISKTSSLGDADNYELSPMMLFRHGTKWLIEFEPSFNNGSLSVNWADIHYFACPGLQIKAGYMVLPFGIYSRRLAAGWIDKVAGDPVGIDLPGADFGVGISGGLPLGNMKWSYDVTISNGLQLLPDGELQNAGLIDNNLNKTFSGRLGLLPFSNSSLEIGVSGLYGGVGDAGAPYQNANATMYGADLSYVKTFNPLLINIKAQVSRILVNSQQFVKPTDFTSYTFDNNSTSAFAQLSVRPVSVDNNFVKNLELAFRYTNYKTPNNSTWGANYDEEDIGLDYWLSWRTVLKFTYTKSHSLSTANVSAGGLPGTTDQTNLYLQFSIQF